MRKSRLLLLCLLQAILFMMISSAALASDLPDFGVEALQPVLLEGTPDGAPADLYLGPTAQFARLAGQTLDTSSPFLYFGQADCWAMVGLGTPEAPASIGWIQASAAQLPEEPLLDFPDALPLDLPEDTALCTLPDGETLCSLPAGTRVILLAHLGEWGYLQAEPESGPVRAFAPLSALE